MTVCIRLVDLLNLGQSAIWDVHIGTRLLMWGVLELHSGCSLLAVYAAHVYVIVHYAIIVSLWMCTCAHISYNLLTPPIAIIVNVCHNMLLVDRRPRLDRCP